MWKNLLTILVLIVLLPIVIGIRCPLPSQSLYSHVNISSANLIPGTTAIYSCDEGYELFGSSIRFCLPNGTWSGEEPICAVNVAYGKPSNQSSTAKGRNAIQANNDMQDVKDHCSETKLQTSPWWRVDLLHPYEIKYIQLTSRNCCAQYNLYDIEIRVGNSTSIQSNKLCTWYHDTISNGITKTFHCSYPYVGRYVYIQLVGVHGILSICDVKIFTTQELAVSRCGLEKELTNFTVFNNTCYEFVTHLGDSFQAARNYCKSYQGDIIFNIENRTQNFIAGELKRRRNELKSVFFWMGAQLEEKYKSSTWYWIDKTKIMQFLWAEDQPNNYNKQQNCIVLDGNNKWLWNDIRCDLDDISWICQYKSLNCGNPDRKENSTYYPLQKKYLNGERIAYECTNGSLLIGNKTRECGADGFWKGIAPSCKYIDCGYLQEIENGFIIYDNSRTSFGSIAHYICKANYTLSNHDTFICKSDGKWYGNLPVCSLTTCYHPEIPRYARVTNLSLTVHSTIKYSCQTGHRLIGQNTRTCKQNGRWSGRPPICKYVRCGLLPNINKGHVKYLNGTTFLGSVSHYSCVNGFRLIGNAFRECLENGEWSGNIPKCEVIDCGQPNKLKNGKILLKSHTTTYGSVVKNECFNNYTLHGPDIRKCLENGSWSDSDPYCEVIDCGKPKSIKNGIFHLLNDSTLINSLVQYKCNSGFYLIGSLYNTCRNTGKWSGPRPTCIQEKSYQNSTLNATNNNIGEEINFIESTFSFNEQEVSFFKIGIGIAIGATTLLIIIITIIIIHMKIKRKMEIKDTEQTNNNRKPADVGMATYASKNIISKRNGKHLQ